MKHMISQRSNIHFRSFIKQFQYRIQMLTLENQMLSDKVCLQEQKICILEKENSVLKEIATKSKNSGSSTTNSAETSTEIHDVKDCKSYNRTPVKRSYRRNTILGRPSQTALDNSRSNL